MIDGDRIRVARAVAELVVAISPDYGVAEELAMVFRGGYSGILSPAADFILSALGSELTTLIDEETK